MIQAVGASERMFELLDKEPKIVVDPACAAEPKQFSPGTRLWSNLFIVLDNKEYMWNTVSYWANGAANIFSVILHFYELYLQLP